MLTVASSTVALALCHCRQDSLGKSGGGGGGRNGSQIKGPGGEERGGWGGWPGPASATIPEGSGTPGGRRICESEKFYVCMRG